MQISILSNVVCDLCPHYCRLHTNDTGKCLVRQNVDGQIKLSTYGQISRLATEPIEKRPFFHFLPGINTTSIGMQGCSFKCSYCFNFQVSQSTGASTRYLSPDDVVSLASEHGVIVFTYNEPTVHFEYLRDVADLIRTRRLAIKVCLKTNGFVTLKYLRKLLEFVDAFNVDIKGDEIEYDRVCAGELDPVFSCVKEILQSGKHIEISYLVLPRMITDITFHYRVLDILREDVPLHLLKYYPFYKMTEAGYSDDRLLDIHAIMRRSLRYVYISNVYSKNIVKYRNTYCHKCGQILIDRADKAKIVSLSCCEDNIKGVFR